ncbi:peptidylprolyl isomerase [Allochromatium vinosum]|uniref:Chaperone SurA n=1 Tax=Allochromatium vinosum (strain ATCC 17899 / DSM 180 / NBRC 103801 / NCIMB 10441 / D) TaxID=572477 RepID=D3RQF5_ALLVD|nr:peptidylprolyl isomerase [Allochromatium vinosum]ADC61760.1 SurA domain protein [Allochromatium vinosum DSM 180]
MAISPNRDAPARMTPRRSPRGKLLGLALALGMGPALVSAQALDAIVAVVNDDVVVQSELEREIALVIPQLNQRGTAIPPPEQLRKQVLDRLILKHLQQQRAKELGLKVDEATLEEALQGIAGRNGLSLDELKATLEAGGIRFEDFREDTRSQILSSRLQNQEVVRKIQVSEPEVDRFLAREASRLIEREQVRLQHILIALPENPTPEQVKRAEDKAKGLVERLRSGADFAAVAVRESDGRNALEGGDLGWFEMGAVPSLVSDLAYTLAEGEVSEPLRSPSGFHIIRMREIKAAAPEDVTQTRARHILIRTNEIVSDADARQRLLQLRERIIGGEDFAGLARAHSDDTGSALKGGELGWVDPGKTVPEFEEQMNALAVGATSEPFKSPFGWHILQVEERRQQSANEDILRLKAREALQRRKAEEATEEWLRQLRDEAYVEIRLDQES